MASPNRPGPNIPGLNENLMRQMMSRSPMNSQDEQAQDEFTRYKKKMSPVMQKMMWPSMIASMLSDPMYAGPLLGKMGVNLSQSVLKPILGRIGGASTLIPSALSGAYRSKKLAAERQYAPELGAVGRASRTMDNLASIRNLMTLPGYMAQTLTGNSYLRKVIPRTEHLLTGTVRNALAGKGNLPVEGGGILAHGYGGLKHIADFATGGKISGAVAAGAKQGGLAGAASTGAGMLDKGISGLLSSPLGVSMGMTGVQIGLSIYKSIKLAKLTPKRQIPDKLGRKYFGQDISGPAMNKILQMAGTGKIDPATLSFMVLQVIEGDIRKSNVLISGVRGEIAAEADFIRQEKEKGEKGLSKTYGSEILGEDNRGMIDKSLDYLENTINQINTKFNPLRQMTDFAFGLMQGKWVTPKGESSKIAKMYGFDDEKKMMKEKSESFGTTMEQTRLLHTPSKGIISMASTFDAKDLAIKMATYDINRYMLAELMTIRISAFGIEQNVLHRKEPGAFKQFMSDMFDKLNPMNLPGINAVWNLAKGATKFITQTLPSIPNKAFELGKKAVFGARDILLGEGYGKLKDNSEWNKAAGLGIPSAERAQDYIANGLPEQVERIRSVLFDLYYVQEEMLNQMGVKTTKKDELGAWSSKEKRYIDMEAYKTEEDSKKIALMAVKEHAFREGPLGKLLYLADILSTKVGKGYLKRIAEKETVAESIRRMGKAEHYIGGKEIKYTGEPETLVSKRTMYGALAETSSVQSRKVMPSMSMREIESEKQLGRVPRAIEWKAGGAVVGAAALLLPLLLGPFGLFGSAAAILGYGKKRLGREKEIVEEREKEIESRSPEQRIMETMETYFRPKAGKKSTVSRRFESRDVNNLSPLFSSLGGGGVSGVGTLSQASLTNQYLSDISLKLGKDTDTQNVYAALAPKSPITAEMQLNDSTMENFNRIMNYPQPPPVITYDMVAEKGSKSTTGESYLVGEKGMEVVTPPKGSVVTPYDKLGGIFSRIENYLLGLKTTEEKSLKLQIHESKKSEEAANEQTFVEKMNALKERMKEKAQETWQNTQAFWQKDVFKLLKKKDGKEDEKKKGKGIFGWLFDLVKDIKIPSFIKLLAGGLLAGGAMHFIWSLLSEDTQNSIKTNLSDFGAWIWKKLKEFVPTEAGVGAGVGAVFGAGLGALGGPLGALSGAMAGAVVGGTLGWVWSLLSENTKEQTVKMTKGFGGWIWQKLKDSIPNDLIAGFYTGAGAGAVMGGVFGGPLGILSGAVTGAVIGTAFGAISFMLTNFDQDTFNNAIDQDLVLPLTTRIKQSATTGLIAAIGMGAGLLLGGAAGIIGLVPALGLMLVAGAVGAAYTWTTAETDKSKKIKNAQQKLNVLNDQLYGGYNYSEAELDTLKTRIEYAKQELEIAKGVTNPRGVDSATSNPPTVISQEDMNAGRKDALSNDKVLQRFGISFANEKPSINSQQTGGGTYLSTDRSVTSGKLADMSKTQNLAEIMKAAQADKTSESQTSKILSTGQLGDLLAEASAVSGMPVDFLAKVAWAESTFNPNAVNPDKSDPLKSGSFKGSATETRGAISAGLFGFTMRTWKESMDKWGSKLGLDTNAPRTDPRANALLGAMYLRDKLTELQKNKMTINDANVYSAYFSGNLALAKASETTPEMPIEQFLLETLKSEKSKDEYMAGNPEIYKKGTKVKDAMGMLTDKIQRAEKEMAQYIGKTDLRIALDRSKDIVTKLGGVVWTAVDTFANAAVTSIKDGTAAAKAKDIFGVFADFALDMKNAVMDAWNASFTDEGLRKDDIVEAVSAKAVPAISEDDKLSQQDKKKYLDSRKTPAETRLGQDISDPVAAIAAIKNPVTEKAATADAEAAIKKEKDAAKEESQKATAERNQKRMAESKEGVFSGDKIVGGVPAQKNATVKRDGTGTLITPSFNRDLRMFASSILFADQTSRYSKEAEIGHSA